MLTALLLCSCLPGCHLFAPPPSLAANAPHELDLISLPPYLVEPPDILQIELVNPIPKPPYRIQPSDVVRVFVTGLPETAPVSGDVIVQPDGLIDLGEYGSVSAVGLTSLELKAALERQIAKRFPKLETAAFVAVVQTAEPQLVSGQHLVRPDGTIGLGLYGSLYVSGMTLDEVQGAVAGHLEQFFLDPQISVDVLSYNSKVYYVVSSGGGAGETVTRLPYTGKETVLDAISLIGGLTQVSAKNRIWVARPGLESVHSIGSHDPDCERCSDCAGGDQVLPVHWEAIVKHGQATTNYQLLPGDRIYVDADPLVTLDTGLARVISPVERLLGVVLLGSTTIRNVSGTDNNIR